MSKVYANRRVCHGVSFLSLLTSSLHLPAALHTKTPTAAGHLHHASKETWLYYNIQPRLHLHVCSLMSSTPCARAGKSSCFPLVLGITPMIDGLCPHLARDSLKLAVYFSRFHITCCICVCLLLGFRDVPV